MEKYKFITDKEKKKKKKVKNDMPNRIEDLSPSPLPGKRDKSPFLQKFSQFGGS